MGKECGDTGNKGGVQPVQVYYNIILYAYKLHNLFKKIEIERKFIPESPVLQPQSAKQRILKVSISSARN